MADIPGLIEGAHSGKGLGDRFLRHIERTRILVFVIEAHDESIDLDYRTLERELKLFNPSLAEKPRILAISKIDLLTAEDKQRLDKIEFGHPCVQISSVSGEGLPDLLDTLRPYIEGSSER